LLKTKLKEMIFPLGTLAIVILGWELADYIFAIREIILPNPHEILSAMINNWQSLIYHTGITAFESLFGFTIGCIAGVCAATLFVYSIKSKKALYPYAIALKAAPLYALAPILIIWFGNGIIAKIVMSSMVAFFPVLVSAVKGFSTIEQEKLDLFHSMNASRTKIFFKLRLPNSLPYIFPALKVASTLAVVGATIAEFTGATYGIGHLIVISSYYMDTSLMFASIIMISLFGVLFFYTLEKIEKKVVFWQNPI